VAHFLPAGNDMKIIKGEFEQVLFNFSIMVIGNFVAQHNFYFKNKNYQDSRETLEI
jgi:hypothetical protein